MALGFQARAMQRVLARLGEDALLAGAPGKINVEHNVELFAGIGDTADDNPVLRFSVATVAKSLDPRVGQELIHPEGTFKLDRMVEDNGHNMRFIVVRTA